MERGLENVIPQGLTDAKAAGREYLSETEHAVRAVRCFPPHTALCLSFLLLLIAVFMFGVVMEFRVMMETIPFFSVFLPHLACGGDRGGTAL